MFVLLRQLHSTRKSARVTRPARRLSLAVRHVDAGSCNACEHELGATANLFYDLSCHGITITASPRHADVLLITGAITRRMVTPLLSAYRAMPEPRLVAALGNCAMGLGVLGDDRDLAGPLEQLLPVDVRIPGCPPTPDQIIQALASSNLAGQAITSA
ncbi:MAG: NADH-quinone oxidoreductase subunit B family protein [Acidimicrobiales bacterium]